MLQVGSEPVWQLKRGQTVYKRISDRELLLLVELGHLKPGDLLRKPGLGGGWKSAEALRGLITTPQRPSGRSFIAQAYAVQTKALLAAALEGVIRSRVKVTLIAKHHVRSLNFFLLRSCPPWGKKLDLVNVLPRVRRRIGLLIALVFLGTSGVAVLASFGISAKNPTEHSLPTKLQDRQTAALASDTARPTKISNFPELQPAAEPPASQSVSNPLASESAAPKSPSVSQSESTAQTKLAANPPFLHPSESIAQTDPIFNLPSASQSAPQTEPVPLPTRKPARPSTKAAEQIVRRHGPRERKAMRFGGIGYNYDPQQ
jgi:hypothetical protein